MDLSPYIESVRAGVVSASSLADEPTQHVAARLGTAIESSTRLALIRALSDAAGTISAELAPSSVEVRMVGSEPEFVVSIQTADAEPTLLMPESEQAGEDAAATSDVEDEPVARISLRLPQSVKTRVDEIASAEGISTNAWMPSPSAAAPRRASGRSRRVHRCRRHRVRSSVRMAHSESMASSAQRVRSDRPGRCGIA
jgi:hypothetical protein